MKATIEAMLAHLGHYADRYYCDGFYRINKIREDIAHLQIRSLETRDQLQAGWCGQFLKIKLVEYQI